MTKKSQSNEAMEDRSKNGCRHVTLELIRKRAEHNESMVSNLEEIALHQEELESIGTVLGRTCGKTLKILLLQNNVISRLTSSEMRPFKSLEYLNLALNNLDRITTIDHLESLNKLDLTLNFIDVDTLKQTMNCLAQLRSLRELYLTGNPCIPNDLAQAKSQVVDQDTETKKYTFDGSPSEQNQSTKGWKGCRMYVIARLHHLEILDGKEVLRSERIKARQCLSNLEMELEQLSALRRKEKNQIAKTQQSNIADNDNEIIPDDQLIGHTPEVRAKLSREIAQQKEAKEKNERTNQPKRRGEKEFEQEQEQSIFRERQRKDKGEVRQCNEGKYEFHFDEESCPGFLLLDINVPRFLSTSLIDVDVNPTYISVIIKSKVLRLNLPVEVKSNDSSAQRSTTTGNLLIKMRKCNPDENIIFPFAQMKKRTPTIQKGGNSHNVKSHEVTDIIHQGQQHSNKRGLKLDAIVKSTKIDKNGISSKKDCIGLFEVKTKCHVTSLKNDSEKDLPQSFNTSSSSDEDDDDGPPPLV